MTGSSRNWPAKEIGGGFNIFRVIAVSVIVTWSAVIGLLLVLLIRGL